MISTVGRTHLTANEFREALLTTPPGTPVVYFTGELGHDLHMAALAKDPNGFELRLVVRLAIVGSDAGELALTQKRVGEIFEYRATPVRPKFRTRPRVAGLLASNLKPSSKHRTTVQTKDAPGP